MISTQILSSNILYQQSYSIRNRRCKLVACGLVRHRRRAYASKEVDHMGVWCTITSTGHVIASITDLATAIKRGFNGLTDGICRSPLMWGSLVSMFASHCWNLLNSIVIPQATGIRPGAL